MAIINVANDQQLVRAYAVTEATPGAGGTPTFALLGQMTITEARGLADVPSYAGTYMQDYTADYGPTDIGGSYTQPLSFEMLATLPRYAFAAAPTPVSDAETTPGYTYTYRHDTTRRTRQTMAVLHSIEEMPEFAKGVRFPAFNVSCDTDAAGTSWQLNVPTIMATSNDLYLVKEGTATSATATTLVDSGAAFGTTAYVGGWVHITGGLGRDQAREVISHTATALTVATWDVTPDATSTYVLTGPVPDIAVPEYELIPGPDTQTFIAPHGATIGAGHDDSDRVISWNVGFDWPVNPKRYQGSGRGYDAKTGNGSIRVAGSVRMEFDSPKEYRRFVNRGEIALRFKQTGSVIDSGAGTTKLAQIDVFRAALEAPAKDVRVSNLTQTINFRGLVDPTEGIIEQIVSKCELATLP